MKDRQRAILVSRMFIPITICCVFTLLVSPPIGAATPPKHGGTLRVGLAKDITVANPFVTTRSTDQSVRNLMFEPLLDMDSTGHPQPYLAESWMISKDGLEYTFKLKTGIPFHNGRSLTSDDIKWCVEYASDPKNGAYGRTLLGVVQSVLVVDPNTIRMTLKEPYGAFLATLSSIQPFPVVPKGSLETGMDRPRGFPPGTGPFQYVDWRAGERLVLKRFPGYWKKGVPFLDELVLTPVPDENVRLTSLRSGDQDMIERVPHEQVLRIRKGEIKEVILDAAELGGYRRIAFNVKKMPFDDVKIRQAVAYGIDKKELIEAEFWGLATPADQKTTKASRWYVPLPERRRDIAKAKALLAQAGFPQGIKVPALTWKGNESGLQVIQRQLKDAGIEVAIEILDNATYTARQRVGDFAMILYGGGVPDDPDLTYYSNYHTETNPKRTDNISGYSNPRVDRLLEEGRRLGDFDKRYKIYKEVVDLLHEELPDIPYAFTPYFFGMKPYVKGFSSGGDAHLATGRTGLPFTWLDK